MQLLALFQPVGPMRRQCLLAEPARLRRAVCTEIPISRISCGSSRQTSSIMIASSKPSPGVVRHEVLGIGKIGQRLQHRLRLRLPCPGRLIDMPIRVSGAHALAGSPEVRTGQCAGNCRALSTMARSSSPPVRSRDKTHHLAEESQILFAQFKSDPRFNPLPSNRLKRIFAPQILGLRNR
jgi:hypothetical protein